MAENNKEKSPNKKISTINYYLFGLVVISMAAFFGFGAIFSQMQLNIGAQATSAAFAALFIILSTKFLMEKESENKLKDEKASKVFDENLKDYKSASQKMLNILEYNRITEKELHVLMHSHADLIILGHVDAIKASENFITKCQNILLKSLKQSDVIVDSRDQAYNISVEESEELWRHIVEFQLASRDGLNLKDNALVLEDLSQTFVKLNEEQDKIDMEISKQLGVDDWLLHVVSGTTDTKEYETIKKNTEKLIKVIKDVGLNVTIKKTQISFANPKHKTKARVIYLNNYAQTKKSFHLSFAGTKNHDFFKKLKTKLEGFNPNIREGRGKFDIAIHVNSKNIEAPIIPEILKAYIKEFH